MKGNDMRTKEEYQDALEFLVKRYISGNNENTMNLWRATKIIEELIDNLKENNK